MFGYLRCIVIGWVVAVCYFRVVFSCSARHQPGGLLLDCSCGHMTSFPVFPSWGIDIVQLNVSYNNLSVLPDFLNSSFPRLQRLDVSHNVIGGFGDGTFGELSQLRNLDASYNRLRFLSSSTFTGLSASLGSLALDHNQLDVLDGSPFVRLSNLTVLRLDSNKLTSLFPQMFRGLEELRYLDLSNNNLGTLRNDTFTALVNLRSLFVRGNQLRYLEPDALSGLKLLTEMDFMYNKLQYQSLPKGVFASLESVKSVELSHNDQQDIGGYPEGVFGDLEATTYLMLDTFIDITFGPDFTRLSVIHTVDVSRQCKIHRLTNSSLQGFRNSSLNTLIFADCNFLTHIETCAFCALPNLKHLSLRSSHSLVPQVALLALYGLQGQSMEEINLRHVAATYTFAHTIDREHMKYLKNVCVRWLVMAGSTIERWTTRAVSATVGLPFAKCVQHIDISENRIVGDFMALIKMLIYYKNLTSVSLQEQRINSLQLASCLFSQELECGNRGPVSPKTGETLYIPIPPKLTYVNASSLSGYFNSPPAVLKLHTGLELKTLDISFGALSHCVTTFVGAERLETLAMDGNYCDHISDDIFDHLPSLRRLSLVSSHLRSSDIRFRAQRLLRNLTNLESLDLSRNALVEIQGHRLPAQRRLRQLRLSSNSFTSLPVDLGFHLELTDLDLSYNKIASLSSAERRAADALAARHVFRLHLRGNPLLCACSSRDFLLWLWDTSVDLDGDGGQGRRYMCVHETGEITDTEQVRRNRDLLWKRCIGKQVFSFAMAAFLLQLMALVVAYQVARNWTHIVYAWNIMRRIRLPRREDFRKDVYLVYAEADTEYVFLDLRRRLEQYGLRLLLRHLEDAPSSVMAENIVKNIEDSWKVLLLVTRSFAECDWSCGYTVQQAQRSITDTLPDRVLVVFLEDPRHLPPMASVEVLLRKYPEKNVFHMHRDLPGDHPAWAHLARTVLGEEGPQR